MAKNWVYNVSDNILFLLDNTSLSLKEIKEMHPTTFFALVKLYSDYKHRIELKKLAYR